MKTLIATFALASIVATSTIAVARDANRIQQQALYSTEYGSPNAVDCHLSQIGRTDVQQVCCDVWCRSPSSMEASRVGVAQNRVHS